MSSPPSITVAAPFVRNNSLSKPSTICPRGWKNDPPPMRSSAAVWRPLVSTQIRAFGYSFAVISAMSRPRASSLRAASSALVPVWVANRLIA